MPALFDSQWFTLLTDSMEKPSSTPSFITISTPDEALPAPMVMPELKQWSGALEGGPGPQGVPQTPRHLAPAGGGSSRLQQMAASSTRQLDPLLQSIVQGREGVVER